MADDPTAGRIAVAIVFDGQAVEIDAVNHSQQSWRLTDEIAQVRHVR